MSVSSLFRPKHFKIDPFELAMFVLVILGTVVRFTLIVLNWPGTNSDEGNMGLLAMHVAFRGEWPIFFYGLPYLGPVEGYIAAPLFHLFGVSLFSLRLGMIPIFALFAITMYFLVRMLYNRPFALFMTFLFCTGISGLLSREVKVVGEYPETELFAAFICLLLTWLALTASPTGLSATQQERRKRIAIYALLGLIIGIALWVDFLILPFVGTGALLLFLFCRRELRSWPGISLLLGTIIGAFPLILYNITAPLNRNSFAVLLDIHHSGAEQMTAQHLSWISQLSGAAFISLPVATGLDLQCPQSAYPFFGPFNSQMLFCSSIQGAWAIAYGILCAIAMVLATRVLWRGRQFLIASLPTLRRVGKRSSAEHDQTPAWSFDERQQLVHQCARLMLLISAAGTWLLYALSPVAATVPGPTSRYLIGMFVALPAVLWPLWRSVGSTVVGAQFIAPASPTDTHEYRDTVVGAQFIAPASPAESHKENRIVSQHGRHEWGHEVRGPYDSIAVFHTNRRGASSDQFIKRHNRGVINVAPTILCTSLLLLVSTVFLVGTIRTFTEVPSAQNFYEQEGALVQNLERLGATRIYSEYWTCNRLTFRSQEHIICAVLNADLTTGFDRYLPYRTLVQNAPNPAFVFPLHSTYQTAFEQYASQQHIAYQRYIMNGYAIYLPATKTNLPRSP